jgi:hypothetical protein
MSIAMALKMDQAHGQTLSRRIHGRGRASSCSAIAVRPRVTAPLINRPFPIKTLIHIQSGFLMERRASRTDPKFGLDFDILASTKNYTGQNGDLQGGMCVTFLNFTVLFLRFALSHRSQISFISKLTDY